MSQTRQSDRSHPPKARVRRAVSESDKAARRTAILEAAERQLRAGDFEAFSMEVLARELGVARGTLYRYFATREEVLLALYLDQRNRFAAALEDSVRPGVTDRAFVDLWYRHATSDPLFLLLQARLGSVIERNVSIERLIAAKTDMQSGVDAVAARVADALSLDVDRTHQLIIALMALLLGATEIDNSEKLPPLPPRFRHRLGRYDRRTVFSRNALLILEGLKQQARSG